ncbi:hypothetical protein Tco_0008452 [Tanacetum coccineum]
MDASLGPSQQLQSILGILHVSVILQELLHDQVILHDMHRISEWQSAQIAKKMEYLERIITKKGVAIDPTKIQAMQNYLSSSLSALLRKNAFGWNENAQKAFKKLQFCNWCLYVEGRCLKEKLSGNNFNDWFRQLKLVLRVEKKMFVIEQPLPAAPAANFEAQVLLEWNAVYDAYNEVACLILGSMTAELHRQFENSSPYDMIKELKAMFEKQAGVERFDLIQTFHACKQEEGKPVAAYVIQMKGYVDQLKRLGYVLQQDL